MRLTDDQFRRVIALAHDGVAVSSALLRELRDAPGWDESSIDREVNRIYDALEFEEDNA